MKLEAVKALFTLANIEVLGTWELMNDYWPRAEHYYKIIVENPWWLVKTKAGLVKIGVRKRVVSISWEDTPIRKIITDEDVTKDETMVHAWTDADAVNYLKALALEIDKVEAMIRKGVH